MGLGSLGAGIGIGTVFASMIQSVARQPELRGELQGIMTEARRTRESMERRMREETEAERQRRLEETRREIAAETQRALEQIRREVAELTLVAASKVTRKALNDDDHRRLIAD